ncbi:hypothetical protein MOQ_008476 [Trypanosoma cruzi marinkellei]|uniref:WW domain-containing protein n=1 Tax=Trypanosoma cruzi marinkellei TaxID=85056 RepID=K2NFK3_TRYCR|nr:hypothetical protein MOQ_008476 [Trypanosoma cruzi marinkellei]
MHMRMLCSMCVSDSFFVSFFFLNGREPMVVLRIIGDEWSWEDRIALAVPPQKIFTMCIPLLISKLGVEKWNGLVLYKTEGKPPKYCRATTPIDMASNPQKERLRDGAVLWVRVGPSLTQQERDRVFQKSLEEWREKNGLKGVSVDGSDVRRFVEEMNSRLNRTDAALLTSQEQEARTAIEGEEHRLFFYMTMIHREKDALQREEAEQRQSLEDAYMRVAEQNYREHRLLLLRTRVVEFGVCEERSRLVIQEEQWREFEMLQGAFQKRHWALQDARERQISDSKAMLEEQNQGRGEMSTHEETVGTNADVAMLVSVVHAELQRLLEPLEKVYHEKVEILERQREATVRENEKFLASLRHYIGSLFRVIRSEMRLSDLSLLSVPSDSVGMEEINEALRQQEGLLKELAQEYRDLDRQVSSAFGETALKKTLSTVHVTQLNLYQYLESLRELLSATQLLWCGVEEAKTQESAYLTQDALEKQQQEEPERKASSLEGVTETALHTERMDDHTNGEKNLTFGIHRDVYNILLMFVSRYVEFSSWGPCHGAEGSRGFLDELLLNCGSLQVAVDELSRTCKVLPHPMRGDILHVVEAHAPHLFVVLDLMLHLYSGREAELLLWIRPELNDEGGFVEYKTDDGFTYYYHTAAGMSQWVRPVNASLRV